MPGILAPGYMRPFIIFSYMSNNEQQRQKELALIQDAIFGGIGADRFSTTHNLDFEVAPWPYDPEYQRFRVGTVGGLWGSRKGYFVILAIHNSSPGNGHLEDVFEWFEYSCRREALDLMVDECWNEDFKKHLIEKRGFRPVEGRNAVIKDVRDM